MSKTIIVAGAGLGGLATAMRLAKRGYKVQILEKNLMAGGRLNKLEKDGFIFDTGPSFFSMSYEFTEFADDCGIELPFKYYSLDPLYTVNFRHRENSFILYRDIARLSEQFKDIEPDFEEHFREYISRGKALFEDTIDIVVKRNHNSISQYLTALMKVPPAHFPVLFRNFWQQVSKHFTSAEARQIMALVAFFLGETPFNTSAVYTLLSYTEFVHDGYFNVEGGMYRIVEGLVTELEKKNVKIIYDTEIIDYESRNGHLQALVDSKGNKWHADIFIVNADAAVFRGKVLKRTAFSEAKLDRMRWTMGPLTIYLGIKGKLNDIHHHNYYLGDNFKEYAGKVFVNPSIRETPYYYVNVLSRSNPQCAPPGCESLFFVCPVPDLRYKTSWDDRDIIVNNIINDFSKRMCCSYRLLFYCTERHF